MENRADRPNKRGAHGRSSAELLDRLSEVLKLLPEIVALRLEGKVRRSQLLDLCHEKLLLALERCLLGLPPLLLEPQHVF